MLNILSIGGSDPSSGAGIQSDIRSCESLCAYCLTAVTGITSQNTTKFGTVEPVSAKILREQLEMIFSDFEIDAIKIGMVYSPGTIRTIHDILKGKNIPIVLDPVIRSTTCGMLITKRAVQYLKRYLVPLSITITPNRFEAGFLTDSADSESTETIAQKLWKLGAKNIVITGLDRKNHVADYILTDHFSQYISIKKIPQTNHGSGCIHSLAFCYALADKKTMLDAAKFSQKFTRDSIKNSRKIGSGIQIVQPGIADVIHDRLSRGIEKFGRIRDIYKHVPECQTNFVYAKTNPASVNDVLGIEGRIVRSGRHVAVAGSLRYGGSKHVASAILVANKAFPTMRAAVNIKFDKDTLCRLEKSQLDVLSYDRGAEPADVKIKGSSVIWGIKEAMQKSENPPDAIFHNGDFGKEPMIIIFGKTPANVITKLRHILE